MAYKTGAQTITTTGLKTLTTTFTPIGYRIWVGASVGGPDGFMRYSRGQSDGTNQSVSWGFADSTIQDCNNDTTKVIVHKVNSGGSLVDDMVAAHNSFTATGPKINVTTLNATFQIYYEAWS